MLELEYHKQFLKNFKSRISHDKKLNIQFKKRLSVFLDNPKNILLKDHGLAGTKLGYRSFSINGDLRVIYTYQSLTKIVLVDIGSHNQVYK
jgi:addiction module RelE/StbE family toxin